MRILFIASVFFIGLSACNSETKKKENKVKKEVLFGSLKNGNYSNTFFNISVDFNEKWKVDTKSYKSISFGGDLLNAQYLYSFDQYFPITVTMTADKANPFGSKSPVEQLKESQEGYEMLFDNHEMIISPFDKVSIAGEDYAHGLFTLIDDTDTSFVNEYYRFYQGFFISIICVHNTGKDEELANEFINSIKRNK